jgi:tungstate transport system ATP-binding protein
MTLPSILPLRLDGLCYDASGRRLLHGLDLTLEAGPRTVILGPNGAGKSLTLRLLHGLLTPAAGTVDWNGQTPNQVRHRQAMVFQRPVMLRRSVAANVAYALACRDVAKSARPALIAEGLELTGLSELAHRSARVLSVGEQQRLALARAWVLKPEVLFLDEPTASLDPGATRAVENIIASIVSTGTKVILTTQDLGQARRLADEIVFLYDGNLLEHGPAEQFFSEPKTTEAQAFIAGEI